MSFTPSISELLKFARVQMAAEALYDFNARTNSNLEPGQELNDSQWKEYWLTTGNDHASKFTADDAKQFSNEWSIVAHKSNTLSGFSGTLFKNNSTGEFVLSCRSTEFIDDAARDCEATNKLEISETGWAMGQISDLENWYSTELKGLISGGTLNVTGYSLGGHLATAFNIMHHDDLNGGKVYTFNGAGVGQIDGGDLNIANDSHKKLSALLVEFDKNKQKNANINSFKTDVCKSTYIQVQKYLSDMQTQKKDIDSTYLKPISQNLHILASSAHGSELQDILLLSSAIDRVIDIIAENDRVAKLTPESGKPKEHPATVHDWQISAEQIDYQIAVLIASKHTKSLAFTSDNVEGIFGDAEYADVYNDAYNQYNIVGTEMDGTTDAYMVAHSQMHYGSEVSVFIEDQPGSRGNAEANFITTGTKLIYNEYNTNDFGDTHSLVLLIDSLKVSDLFSKLDSSLTYSSMNQILKCFSNKQAKTIKAAAGKCEGDVLENAITKLANLFKVTLAAKMTPSLDGNTWWDKDNRAALQKNITQLQEATKSLSSKIKISITPDDIYKKARTDFSALVSLLTLSPIYLTGKDSAAQSALTAQLATTRDELYKQWNGDAGKADSQRVFTDAYLKDRADMLSWVIQGNFTDAPSTGNQMSVSGFQAGTKAEITYTDIDTNNSVAVTINSMPSEVLQKLYDDAREPQHHSVSFGSSANDTLSGERQYGGAGDDILKADTKTTYLEGGKGKDTYQLVSGSHCTILDCDGQGIIQIDGKAVSGVFVPTCVPVGFSSSSNVSYYSSDNVYRLTQNNISNWSLAFKPTGASDYQTVAELKGWNSGQFGISLGDSPTESRIDFDVSNSMAYQVIDASAAPDKVGTIIHSGKTVDFIKGSGYKDEIITGEGSSLVMSLSGDDQIKGGSSHDYIMAGGNFYPTTISDNDIVIGGGDSDVLFGGGGDDILWADNDDDTYLTEAANSNTIGDWLSGSKGSDKLYGSNRQDILMGGSEDDQILGGAGNDLILGDAYTLPNSNLGSPIVGPTVLSSVLKVNGSYCEWVSKLNDSYNPLMLVGSATFASTWSVTADKNISITNSTTDFTSFLSKRVEVNAGSDYLDGGKGNDWIAGQAGDDTLLGGEGDDILYGDDAQALNWGVEGNDKIYTGAGIDYAYGGGGNDIINATDPDNAKDWLYGGTGDDILTGGTGKDQLQGDAGNDDLYAGTDGSTLLGGEGNDYLVGEIGNDDMQGGTGSDFYASSSGTDTWKDSGGSDVYQLSSIDFTGAAKTTIIDTDGLGVILIDGIKISGTDVTATSKTTWKAKNGVYNLALTAAGLVITFPQQTATGQAIIQGFANTGSYMGIKLPDYTLPTQPQPVNHAPTVATAIADQAGKENIAFSYVVSANTFADSDSGETLTLSATLADGSALPSWIKFNATTRTFTGTPVSGNSGLFNIKVTATDHAGASVNDTFSLKIASETINGTAGADTLSGSATKDKIYGLAGNDTLTGSAGDDVLDGGAGADKLLGGIGNDTYFIDNAGDVIVENVNEGTDLVNSSLTYSLSTNLENLTLTGTAVINGSGNELNNTLIGNSAANILTGAAGNDTLNGGAGADKLIGGLGNDIYVIDNAGDVITENANEGIDLVNSSLTYTLGTNLENLTLTGTAVINGTGNELNNTLIGNNAANILTGAAGNDTLNGGAGADKLIGGLGNDTYVIDNAGDVIVENANEGTELVNSSLTYTLGSNLENLTLTGTAVINGSGNELNNTLIGNNAANILTGAAGNDTLNGGAGADKLIGGLGNDTYVIDNAGDVIVENANEGTELVNSSLTYTLGSNLENLTLTGTAVINGSGNELNNTLIGNSAANTLTGVAGNDILNGGAGADKLIGGLGNDIYVIDNAGDVIVENANEGTELVNSSLTYTLGSNLENLTLTGTAVINGSGNELNNTLIGNSAANTLTGAAGNDILNGGAGADKLIGGTGNDFYIVENISDVVTENVNEGFDTVQSLLSNYTLGNNVEGLILGGVAAINGSGNGLSNNLVGNAANNVLNGGAGNDTLNGNAGADNLAGGTGNDTYVMGRGYGNDSINENDTIAGNTDMALFQSGIAIDQIWFHKANNNLEVSIIGTNDKLTIQSWYTGNQYHVEQFKTADGKVLLDSQVNALVSAMAAFTPPAAGQMTLPSATSNQLQPVLAANWH